MTSGGDGLLFGTHWPPTRVLPQEILSAEWTNRFFTLCYMSAESKKEDYMLFQNKLNKESITLMLSDYPNIAESEKLENHTKKTLAALLFIYENTKASESGKLYMDLQTVRRVAGVKMVNVKLAIHQLEQYGLIEYEKGERKGKASGFQINFEKLRKPLIINEGNELGNESDKYRDNSLKINEGYPLHYTTLYNTLQNNTELYINYFNKIITEIDNKNINFLREFSDMKTELTKLKENLSVIENKLTEIVKETVTSYLSENFEKTVRDCISDLVTEHLQKESLNPNKGEAYGKKSEAPSSPVLEKEAKVAAPCPSQSIRVNLSSQKDKKSEAQSSPALEKEELEVEKWGEAPSNVKLLLIAISADSEIYDFFDKKVFDTLGRFSEDLSTKVTFVNTMHNGCNAYFQARRSTSTFFPDEKKRNYVRMLLHKYLYAIVNTTLSPESIAKNTNKNGDEAKEESRRLRNGFKEQYLQMYALEKDK